MPRDANDGDAKSKPAMIREVLTGDLDLPTPKVQAAVWERFGGEVTAQEIARERKKLKPTAGPGTSSPLAETPMPKPVRRPKAEKAKPAPRCKRPGGGSVRANDFGAGEVTVTQLAAILEVADEVGGLRRLRDAVAT